MSVTTKETCIQFIFTRRLSLSLKNGYIFYNHLKVINLKMTIRNYSFESKDLNED